MTPCDPESPIDTLKHAVGTAIHDINNLLLVMNCCRDKLLQQLPPTDPARGTAAEIGDAAERIAEITARLQASVSGPRPSDPQHPRPTIDANHATTGATVLLVDDDSQVRQFVKTALTRSGFKVLEARHGPAAIAVALRHRGSINLLVTDMLMPEMTGRELAAALRTDVPDLRVLYLSGMDSTDGTVSSSGETDAFVQKPFRMPELLLKIREILDK